jgi:hypothetical protein
MAKTNPADDDFNLNELLKQGQEEEEELLFDPSFGGKLHKEIMEECFPYAQPMPTKEQRLFCPRCGHRDDRWWAEICPRCGTPAPKPPPPRR